MTTTLEDCLEAAAQDVRRGVGGMQVRPAEFVSIRDRRQRVLATSTVVVVVSASLLGLGILAGKGPSTAATDVTPTVAVTAPPETAPQQPKTEDIAQTATAGFWAETLANWAGIIEAGVLQEGLDADVIDYWESATPMAEGGSLGASVEATEAQLTLLADFRAFAEGEYRDDPSWQMEVAASKAQGVTTEVGTSFFTDQATFFYTEANDGSRLVTVVTRIGLLMVRADALDPSRLPDMEELKAIATGMTGTAYDLVLHPDDRLPTTEVQSPRSPEDGQWIQLDNDVWIASVSESSDSGDNARIWVKTDTQQPTAAPSTDTRSLVARAGDSDLIVIVFDTPGEQLPESVTAQWSDGGSESGELVWNEDLGVGLARLEWRDDDELEMIEGP